MNVFLILRSTLINTFLTSTEKRVLNLLLGTKYHKVDKSKKIYSTFKRIASLSQACQISRNSCYRALTFLETFGLVQIETEKKKVVGFIIGEVINKKSEMFIDKFLRIETRLKKNPIKAIFDFEIEILEDSSKKYCFSAHALIVLEYLYEVC